MPIQTLDAGIGLRAKHIRAFDELRPDISFVEVHAENHLCGGPMRQALHRVRRDYPISMHCVGMSLGSTRIDKDHIARIRALADEVEPALISDHLTISTLDGAYTNDLLPLPYTQEALDRFAANVDEAQTLLGRQLLIENPSRYVAYANTEMSEAEFLKALAERTGCALICDVNNLFVTAHNDALDPVALLDAFPFAHVKELHVAGHDLVQRNDGTVRIDTHDRQVCTEVWQLLGEACKRTSTPVLVEWDAELPELDVLLAEATHAKAVRAAGQSRHAHAA